MISFRKRTQAPTVWHLREPRRDLLLAALVEARIQAERTLSSNPAAGASDPEPTPAVPAWGTPDASALLDPTTPDTEDPK